MKVRKEDNENEYFEKIMELEFNLDNKIHPECPICYTFMSKPSKLPCNHYFCIPCLKKVL